MPLSLCVPFSFRLAASIPVLSPFLSPLTCFGSLGVLCKQSNKFERRSLDNSFYLSLLTSHFSLKHPPLGRICNPTAISMSICNAERKRITNPYTRCCRISNPAERSLGVWTILLTAHGSLLTRHFSLITFHLTSPSGAWGASHLSLITYHLSLKQRVPTRCRDSLFSELEVVLCVVVADIFHHP